METQLINPDLFRMLEDRLTCNATELKLVLTDKQDLQFLLAWHSFGRSEDGRRGPIIRRQAHVLDLSVRGVACIVAWYYGAIDRSFPDFIKYLNSCALLPSEQAGLFPYYEQSKSSKPE